MNEVLTTTVSRRHRTISLLLESGTTDRYALVRRRTGDVYWSLDHFENGQWAGHGGAVTAGDVIARVPEAEHEVLRWTSEEIEDGVDIMGVDIFTRENRRRSLEALRAELDALQRVA